VAAKTEYEAARADYERAKALVEQENWKKPSRSWPRQEKYEAAHDAAKVKKDKADTQFERRSGNRTPSRRSRRNWIQRKNGGVEEPEPAPSPAPGRETDG